MCSNTTCPPSFRSFEFNFCNLDGIPQNHSSVVRAAMLSISILVAILSPLAVAGNTIILAVIWRNPSLRTPSYILLCGLVLTDLCTGLISQPFYVAIYSICLAKPVHEADGRSSSFLKPAVAIAIASGSYFGFVTVLTITLMSIERWLHMARRSLLTRRRACLLVVASTVLPIPLTLFRLFDVNKGSHGHGSNIAVFLFLLICLITTTFAYWKVFRIIREHQQQVQANEVTHNGGQPGIDLAKYKRSVVTILYILGLFYICYLPVTIQAGLFVYLDDHAQLYLPFQLALMLLFLSSSLNPVLYVWRMKDIRAGVKQLLSKLICNKNDMEVQARS